MQVSVEKLPKSRVKLTVELPADEVRPYLDAAARALSTEHPVKGFRPGAVPLPMLRSVVGDDALVERTLKDLVPKTYVETLLDREDIEAIGRPEVMARRITIGEPWAYEATVAVLPEVLLGNYRHLRGEKRAVTVETHDVEHELHILRRMRASYLTVPRPAQTGDRVELDLRATHDRVPLEVGGGVNESLLLGEGHLVPGFEEQIVGLRAAETKVFTITFPAQHHRQNLRGKTVEFTVTVKVVQQQVLPELSDSFAQGLGKFASLADLRAKLSDNLRAEKEARERERLQLDLLRQVVAGATFGEFPDTLVEGEVEKMLAELQGGLTDTGLTFEQYLGQIKKTVVEVRAGFRPKALERVHAGLTLRAVAKAERVEVTDAEVADEVNGALRQFPHVEEAKKRVSLEELREAALGAIRNRKVFALLEQFAGVA